MQNDICEGKYHNNTPEGMIYSESAWVINKWKDVTDPLFTTHNEALNKFAIEQQIKALEWMAKNVVSKELSVTTLWKRIEQLRKEQE